MSNTTHQEADKTPEELAEYWTEERRRRARPKPLPTPGAAASEPADDSGDVEVILPNTSVADEAQREADRAENRIGKPVPNRQAGRTGATGSCSSTGRASPTWGPVKQSTWT